MVHKRSDFEVFYKEHLAAVAGYTTRRCNSADAVDVVAETFVVAWRRFDIASEHPNPRAWLFGVARRVLSNHHRSADRRLALSQRVYAKWMPHCSALPSPTSAPLDVALARVSDADREILLLAGVDELSPTEIGVVLGIPPGSARTRLSRARKRLGEHLNRIESDTHAKEQA